MAGFKKAKSQQAAIKLGIYGKAGTGKTFTGLLFLEGLSKITKKKTAVVDTEHGTDFYAKAVKERTAHPEAFEFDALYTRSITEVLFEVKKLDPKEYGQVMIDSITHLWEAAMNAYDGKRTGTGEIPVYAWGPIKKPFKELLEYLMNSPFHFIICGRQGVTIYQDEEGQTKVGGPKMKSEGETPHEPHLLFRMEMKFDPEAKQAAPTVYVEKNRMGPLSYQWIEWPTFDNCIKPLLPYLDSTQAQMPSSEEASIQDIETLTEDEKNKITQSQNILDQFRAKFKLARSAEEVAAVATEITPELKKQIIKNDLAELKKAWLDASAKYPGGNK